MISNFLNNRKSPKVVRGFFLCIVLIDFLILFLFSSNLFLLMEFVLFQIVYFFYLKGSLRKLVSIFILSSIIFMFNLFQNPNGKTLFANDFFILTEYSLYFGLEKALILFSLFLISSNCIYQNRNLFMSCDSSSILSLSIQKFFYLFERINFNNGKILKNIYLWFYRSLFRTMDNAHETLISLKSFFWFHFIFFISMVISILFSLKLSK